MRLWRDNTYPSSGQVHTAHEYQKAAKKLCTESKEPDQALEFAIAFEEGVKRQRAYGAQASE